MPEPDDELADLEHPKGSAKRFYVMDDKGYQLYEREDKTGRYYFDQRSSQERPLFT